MRTGRSSRVTATTSHNSREKDTKHGRKRAKT